MNTRRTAPCRLRTTTPLTENHMKQDSKELLASFDSTLVQTATYAAVWAETLRANGEIAMAEIAQGTRTICVISYHGTGDKTVWQIEVKPHGKFGYRAFASKTFGEERQEITRTANSTI